jgi:hypothetical protein
VGGYGTGQLTESESVLGAVNNTEMIEELKGFGVEFKDNEPAGGIVGVSGLLLGLSKLKGIYLLTDIPQVFVYTDLTWSLHLFHFKDLCHYTLHILGSILQVLGIDLHIQDRTKYA